MVVVVVIYFTLLPWGRGCFMNVGCVNSCLCVLMGEMGGLEFWSFYEDIDVMLVYVVGADGHMSYVGVLFFFGVL
jgi:hypothetical protein